MDITLDFASNYLNFEAFSVLKNNNPFEKKGAFLGCLAHEKTTPKRGYYFH